jgi:hypothetical protein
VGIGITGHTTFVPPPALTLFANPS